MYVLSFHFCRSLDNLRFQGETTKSDEFPIHSLPANQFVRHNRFCYTHSTLLCIIES